MLELRKFIMICLLIALSLSFCTNIALAKSGTEADVSAASGETGSTAAVLDNPLGENDPRVIIGNIINAILGVVGSLALLMFIYGGVIWLLSQGNEQKVEQGKKLILWAAMGLIVIFTSYALVLFVINAVTGS